VVGAVVLLSLLIDLALWWRGRGEGNSPAALGPGAALRSGGAVADLAFSADGRWLAAANLDGAKGVCLWERATGKKSHLWPGDGVHALAFAPDGRALALGGTGSGELRWCPLPPGEPGNASTVDAKVRALAFAGPMLIGGLEPWKQASRHYLQTWDAATSKPLANPSGLTGNVWSVSVHPGKNLLATGDESGRIQVWSLDGFKRGPQRQTDRHGYSPSVAFVPDGTGLLVGANEADGCHLYLLDPADLAKARWPQPTGITGQIYRLAVDPKGRWAAVAGGQGVVLVSLADGRARPPLDGLPGPATAVAFAPDGALVAGGSKDGAVRLWPVPNP
jgi:WD40 repeat protein